MSLKISYMPLEITLVKRRLKKADLKRDLRISPSTLAKMSRGEYVALEIIVRICDYLECNVEDVIEVVEDREYPVKEKS